MRTLYRSRPSTSAALFTAKDAGYAADANLVYHQGKVLTKNVTSFQVQQ